MADNPQPDELIVTALRNADEDLLEGIRRATELDDAEVTRGLVALIDTLDNPPMPAAGDTAAVPPSRPGHGHVVIEAPLELVRVFASLHPSEQGTAAAQMAGYMRNALVEMRKMPARVGAAPVGDDAVTVAFVTASADMVEANANPN